MPVDNESEPGSWQREMDHAPWKYKPIYIDATTKPDPNARGGVRRYLDTVKPEEYVPNVGEVNLTEMTLTGLADLYGSDKGTIKHNYTRHYEKIVDELLAGRDRKKAELLVVEAGVACGASLRMWGNYLPASDIIGYDVRPECKELCKDMENVEIRIENLCKSGRVLPLNTDLFIDDASHIAEDMVAMYVNCFNRVRSGGYYVIEDLGCTYSEDYTKQYRKYFDPKAVNNRDAIARFMSDIMRWTDAKQTIAEIRYYPQMLVIKRS